MEERPPFVECFLHSIEDREASIREGHYVGKDVVFFRVIPAGGKLEVELDAESHLRTLRKRSDKHLAYYEAAYKAYKEGEEPPVSGTPIRSWPQLDPSMVKTLISLNVRTVEDLATLPDEGLNRIGMHARKLQAQALAWLEAANSAGKIAERLAALEARDKDRDAEMKRVMSENAELRAQLEAKEGPRQNARSRGARSGEMAA
jgi:hypothetical protein